MYSLRLTTKGGGGIPYEFESKKLSPPEQNYTAIKSRALATVKGIIHYTTYLKGNPFVIQSDNNLLTHQTNLSEGQPQEGTSSRLNTEVAELTPKLIVSSESLSQQLRLGSVRATGGGPVTELIQM